jgi:hypothetical protein
MWLKIPQSLLECFIHGFQKLTVAFFRIYPAQYDYFDVGTLL